MDKWTLTPNAKPNMFGAKREATLRRDAHVFALVETFTEVEGYWWGFYTGPGGIVDVTHADTLEQAMTAVGESITRNNL